MREHSTSRQTLAKTLMLGGSLLLGACSIVGGITPQEQAIQQQVDVTQYMPATRDMRDNIETQELFAQAAFWSNEYELNPADLEATIKLAAAVRKLGNPARSVEITQTSRQLHPRDPYLLAEHAAGLIASERALDAVPILDQGLRIAPQYGRLWSLKGAALDQMEDYQAARQHYARALQITPNDPNVLANLGLSHALSGDPQTAEVWLRRAAAQPGAGAGVRQNLALVLQLLGKTEAAEQQSRLSQLSQGDRKLPPQPIPAFTPRGVPAEMAETTSYSMPTRRDMRPAQPQRPAPQYAQQPRPDAQMSAPYGATPQAGAQPSPVLRGNQPQARLTTMDPNGQNFTTSREAARGQVGYQSAPQAGAQPQPAASPLNGEMTAEQMAVLNSIRQGLQPGASGPQPQARQQPQTEQPYLVGPAPASYGQPAGYGLAAQQQSYQTPQSYAAPATRREPVRRRR